MVDSEQGDEEDDASEVGEEAREESSPPSLLASIPGRENTGGRGKDTEARRRSR